MSPTAVVLGVGPGLGMSIAHRFGREGYDVVLFSRRGDRHGDYLKSLAAAGVQGRAFAVDVRDRERLLSTLDDIGPVDVVYYGPGATDLSDAPGEITSTTSEDARAAMDWLYPAVDAVQHVLPGVVERGDIHQTVKSMPERFGSLAGHTLDPDDIAETAWQMFVQRDRAEEVFSAL